MIIFTLEIVLTERRNFLHVYNAMDQFLYPMGLFRDEEYRALCPLSRITVISITFLIESDAVKKVYRHAVKILVTVSRETYGRPVRGDKYYRPTTMRPRTSITCMWKRGFIGDIVPTAKILPSFITTRYVLSTMRGARSSAWQYLLGRQSFTCLRTCWEMSRRIFSRFEIQNVASRYTCSYFNAETMTTYFYF